MPILEDIKKDVSEAVSNVEVFFVDLLGAPIENLKVEITAADKKIGEIYHQAVTDAKGAVNFVVKQGEEFSVKVKHWTKDEMKQVAQLYTSLKDVKFKLQSPKFVKKIKTKIDKTIGEYKRNIHEVMEGDTLLSIAKKYATSVDLVKHINDLKSEVVAIGQHLKVPPAIDRIVKMVEEENISGKPVSTFKIGAFPVIFPVLVRPLNDRNGKYKEYLWSAKGSGKASIFGSGRGKGKRKHAARDLYLEKHTEIVAMAPGEVLVTRPFYYETNEVTIKHTTFDGRQFIARYGEVDPASITVKEKDKVAQGQVIGKCGVMIRNGKPLITHTRLNKSMSMLHLEIYSGAAGWDIEGEKNKLTVKKNSPYQRRSDLVDPLAILQEGYRCTFIDSGVSVAKATVSGERVSVEQLSLSEKGKDFIKDYEKLRLDYYDDDFGYCTVGWGHLVGGLKSCKELDKEGKKITEEEAKKILAEDISTKAEKVVRDAVKAPLYQHEFDALCCLIFNIGRFSRAPNLLKLVNNKEYTKAAAEFLDITNGGVKGLVARRKQENDMFLNNVYDSTH
jgi:GH24 family phage-related lysozyme (muramidase)/LysM repeat protein